MRQQSWVENFCHVFRSNHCIGNAISLNFRLREVLYTELRIGLHIRDWVNVHVPPMHVHYVLHKVAGVYGNLIHYIMYMTDIHVRT